MTNWRLIFCWESARWHGGVASIEQADGDHVIGCVWEIGKENLGELDIQEGVDQNIYQPIEGEGLKNRKKKFKISENFCTRNNLQRLRNRMVKTSNLKKPLLLFVG